MGSVGIILQVRIGVHNTPRMADADMLRVVVRVLPFTADDLVHDGARGVRRGDGADGAGTHVGVDHLHVHAEETAHKVDVHRLDLLAAAGGVVHGLSCEGELRQRLAVHSRVLQILRKTQDDGAGAADHFQLPLDLLHVGACR